jgi:vacuolar-type H+-ATPase subunit F/Vma7
MSDFDKVAIVGEADLVFALRALGVHIFSPKDVEDARKIMAKIEKEKFALCFVHQRWLQVFKGEKKDSRRIFCPAVVGFSDYRSLTDEAEKIVREMAVKAAGSDSLVKRKGKDESS